MHIVCPHCHSTHEVELHSLPAKVYCGHCLTKSLIHDDGQVEILEVGAGQEVGGEQELASSEFGQGSASAGHWEQAEEGGADHHQPWTDPAAVDPVESADSLAAAPTRRVEEDAASVIPAAPRRSSLEQKAAQSKPGPQPPPAGARPPGRRVAHRLETPRRSGGAAKPLFFGAVAAAVVVAVVPSLREPLLAKVRSVREGAPPATAPDSAAATGTSSPESAGPEQPDSPLGRNPAGSSRPAVPTRGASSGSTAPQPVPTAPTSTGQTGPATLASAAPQVFAALVKTEERIEAEPATADAQVTAFLQGFYRVRPDGQTIAAQLTAEHPALVLEMLSGLWDQVIAHASPPETPQLKIFNRATGQTHDLTEYYTELFTTAGAPLTGETLAKVAGRTEVQQLLGHFASGADTNTPTNALWVAHMVHEAGRSIPVTPPRSTNQGGSSWFGRTNPFGTTEP